MKQLFETGDKVIHSNLGEGIFVNYDLYDNESVVTFTDELGYEDDLRVSTNCLSKIKE